MISKAKATFLFLIFTTIIFAQQAKIDSLYQIINTTKNDSTKVAVYNQIIWKYLFSDKIKAKELIAISEKTALKTNQKFGYNSLLGIKAIFFDVNGHSDSAKYYFEKALVYSKKHQFLVHEEHTLNNLGMYHWNQGNFEIALQYFFKSLKVNQKIPENKRGKTDSSLNNIGLIYQEMHLFEKAIEYHEKALAIRKKENNLTTQIHSYNNLGICYKELSQNIKARQAFENGLTLANQINKGNEYYTLVEGLASLEFIEKNYKKALDLYLKSLNRPKEVPINSKNKIHLYSSLATVYLKLNEPLKTITYGETCLQELKLYSENEDYEVEVYKPLAEANYLLGNIEKGSFYSNLFYEKTTQKFKEESAASLQELEVKYETEKKEKALAQEKVRVAEKELKIKNKNNLLLVLGIILISLALLSLLYINQQKFKNKQLQKEKELSEALLKIETNNRLQEQRLSISRDLHDNIGAQLTFIISSIDNLKMMAPISDENISSRLKKISQFTRNTITELRDTIWAMNKENITIEDLKARIANFIDQAKSSTQNLNFVFECDIDDEIVFDAKEGMNIYRIIQEAINNAIKHSYCNTIEIKILQHNSEIIFEIKDNGKGFNKINENNGNGLNSMQKRANEINAKFSITNAINGVIINLTINK